MRRFRAAIRSRDLDQDVFDVGLGVFHEHIEVAVLVEYAGVQQFEFRLVLAAPLVFVDQLGIGKLRLRIFVEILHVGMRRRVSR